MVDAITAQQEEREQFFRHLSRTPLGQVEKELDRVHFLAPAERDRLKQRANHLMGDRKASVLQWLEREHADFQSHADKAEEAVEAVSDAVDELVARVEAGQVPLAEFQQEFARLEHQLHNAQRSADSLARLPARLQRLEDDPEAYIRELEKRFPLLQQSLFAPESLPSVNPQ